MTMIKIISFTNRQEHYILKSWFSQAENKLNLR